jgi:hypothetical protein
MRPQLRPLLAREVAADHAHLVKKDIDYRFLSVQALRSTARHAHQKEETARFAKGRRAWKAVWQSAEEELRRRGVE